MNLAQAKFLDDLAAYLVLPFFVSNQAGQEPDGNAILYVGVAQAIKAQYGEVDKNDADWIRELYRQSMKKPGLITRGPHKFKDHQEHDDYVGLAYFSMKADPLIAMEIVAYGKDNSNIFDNSGRSKNGIIEKLGCWHRRFPGQVEHYKICAGYDLNIFEQAWWALGMLPISSGQSGIQLKWLKFRAYKESGKRHFLMDLGARAFESGIRKKYKSLMGDVFSIYYGKRHIFSRWMDGRI